MTSGSSEDEGQRMMTAGSCRRQQRPGAAAAATAAEDEDDQGIEFTARRRSRGGRESISASALKSPNLSEYISEREVLEVLKMAFILKVLLRF